MSAEIVGFPVLPITHANGGLEPLVTVAVTMPRSAFGNLESLAKLWRMTPEQAAHVIIVDWLATVKGDRDG